MKILHISDIHLPMPPGTIRPAHLLHPRRVLGWTNLMLRRRALFAGGVDKLAELARMVGSSGIDAVVFTGDICHLGTPEELAVCRRLIEGLRGSAPVFICMPGNHDVYLSHTPYRTYFDNLACGGEALGGSSAWPRRYRFDDVDIITLDSTKPNPYLHSSGFIPEEQLDALAHAFAQADRRIIVATHFGLYGEGARPDRASHGIVNAEAYRRVLEAAPAGTVCLHGHTHHAFRLSPPGLPVMLCAGSTTMARREGLWLLETLPDGMATAAQGHWDGRHYSFDPSEPLPPAAPCACIQ